MRVLGLTIPESKTTRDKVARIILFFVYIGAIEVSSHLYSAPAVLSPAPGIGLAGLIIAGIEAWPVIYLASVTIYLFHHIPLVSLILVPIANTLQAVLGAYFLNRLGFNAKLERFRDMFSLLGIAILTSMIIPTIGFMGSYINGLFGGKAIFTLTWGSWWTGTMISILVITPFITSWFTLPERKFRRRDIFEIFAAFASLIVINYLLFIKSIGLIGAISPVYFILIPFMWIALRMGSRFMTLAFVITSMFAFIGVFHGSFGTTPDMLGMRVFQMEIFLLIIGLLFFIIVGIDEERKTVIRKLQTYIGELQDAVGIRDEFISVASHELKTPVTSLKIYSQVMQREFQEKGEETLIKQISKMDIQLNKLVSLVEDLLNVSRSRLGKLEFRTEEFNLDVLVRETVDDVQQNTKHKIFLEGGLTKNVWGDKDRIAQVLVNLINNGVKYSPNANKVVVSMYDESDFARIAVKDFGIGIDKKHHDKIFGLFYRVGEAGGNTFPGFGIGLYISNEIIKRHNGVLEVKSSKGYGSEFSFTIPYNPAGAYTYEELQSGRISE